MVNIMIRPSSRLVKGLIGSLAFFSHHVFSADLPDMCATQGSSTSISDGVPIGVAYITASNSYTGFGVMIGDQSTGVFIDRNAVNGADPATDLAGAMKANTEVYFNLTYTTNT